MVAGDCPNGNLCVSAIFVFKGHRFASCRCCCFFFIHFPCSFMNYGCEWRRHKFPGSKGDPNTNYPIKLCCLVLLRNRAQTAKRGAAGGPDANDKIARRSRVGMSTVHAMLKCFAVLCRPLNRFGDGGMCVPDNGLTNICLGIFVVVVVVVWKWANRPKLSSSCQHYKWNKRIRCEDFLYIYIFISMNE